MRVRPARLGLRDCSQTAAGICLTPSVSSPLHATSGLASGHKDSRQRTAPLAVWPSASTFVPFRVLKTAETGHEDNRNRDPVNSFSFVRRVGMKARLGLRCSFLRACGLALLP